MRVALLLLAVAGAALVAASHASAQQQGCKPSENPGVRKFCGPAKATLKLGGKTYHFREGFCAVDGVTWTLNIGTIVLNQKKGKHAYFGITMFSNKPGTHDAAVSWTLRHHASQSLRSAKVKLARGLKKGTIRGIAPSGGRATGSFTCT